MEKVVPTIGYEYQELRVKNLTLKVWDLSGQVKFRSVWKHYYVGVCGIVFVIDSTDLEKIEQARDEIHHLLAEPELVGVPVCIFANKQDLPQALRYQDIRKELALCGEDDK